MELDEAAVEAFLTKFKASDDDKRVDQVQMFGLQLESTPSLPESTLDGITLCLYPTLRATNHLLVQSTLNSFLPFFVPHLPLALALQNHLRLVLHHFLPPLLEKLNDSKERVATPARTSIALLGKKCFEAEASIPKEPSGKGKEKESLVSVWERNVKDGALAGKGWRGKVEGMKILLSLKGELGGKMTLRPWLSTLVEALEDGDSNVREAARETLVALCSPSSTPAGARTELKKLLQARQVRASIADDIIRRVFSATPSAPTPVSEIPPILDEATSNGVRSGAVTPANDEVSVVYIASARDLEGEFARMLPHFQGRESEHNWNPREQSVIRVRGMLRGKAFQQFPDAFVAGLKAGIFEGLSKTIVSLRTTVGQQSCALLQELAENLSSSFDPFVEGILPILGKMAGYTKKVTADRSQRGLATIIQRTTAHPRLFIGHINVGIQDKNVQTRQFSAVHLKTFLDAQAPRTRQTIEHTSGLLELLVDSVTKGLSDVNPGVRETARPAYWSFHSIWSGKASEIVEKLDGIQKKQLDKVRPSDAPPIPVARPPIGAAKRSSGIGALLAEKRKAAMVARQEVQRTVSSPITGSPSLAQSRPTPRSTSSQMAPSAELALDDSPSATSKTAAAPEATPSRPSTSHRSLISSPSGPIDDEPSPIASPLRQTGNSARSNGHAHKSPTPSTSASSQASRSTHKTQSNQQSGRSSLSPDTVPISTPSERGSQEAQKAQAAQGLMVARHLLDVDDDDGPINPVTPSKPSRQLMQNSLLQTPMNGHGRNIWEDSPGPSAVTPMMMDKLKGRRHERSWWIKRQQYLDKASPFKTSAPAPASAIEPDVASLETGSPELRNLQKLTLFSTSHPISDEDSESLSVWKSGRLFERIFNGLMSFLKPDREVDVLEHGLVLLWELVQHQWSLFEDKEAMLVDSLFTLRAAGNPTILESTNSLVSLLTEVSEPVYLLGLLRASLGRYITSRSDESEVVTDGESSAPSEAKALASGYLFGFNAIGMCILRLPPAVVEVEAPKLAPVVMKATSNTSTPMIPARQAVHHLLLSIQCVLQDSQKTLSIFPDLAESQKNLAMYLMDKNGLLPGGSGSPERIVHEMANLMSRGTA